MNLAEIQTAVESGTHVYWSNVGYEVIKDTSLPDPQWLIYFWPNGHSIGLTWQDGITMNGNEEDFFRGDQ
jgi:hypothetical protein